MDSAAIAVCKDNATPIVVFDLMTEKLESILDGVRSVRWSSERVCAKSAPMPKNARIEQLDTQTIFHSPNWTRHSLVEKLKVDYYGAEALLQQLASWCPRRES